MALVFHCSPFGSPLSDYPPDVIRAIRRRVDAIMMRGAAGIDKE